MKEFRYNCLFFALPLMGLGAGLIIHFRGSDSGIGYVIMCQIFIAFARGMMVIDEQMAVMCASDREGIPMMISLVSLFSNLGGACCLRCHLRQHFSPEVARGPAREF
jgi:hypothetical protein